MDESKSLSGDHIQCPHCDEWFRYAPWTAGSFQLHVLSHNPPAWLRRLISDNSQGVRH
jgi:hypothetical protein